MASSGSTPVSQVEINSGRPGRSDFRRGGREETKSNRCAACRCVLHLRKLSTVDPACLLGFCLAAVHGRGVNPYSTCMRGVPNRGPAFASRLVRLWALLPWAVSPLNPGSRACVPTRVPLGKSITNCDLCSGARWRVLGGGCASFVALTGRPAYFLLVPFL